MPKLTTYQKIIFAYFTITLLLLFLPSFCPQTWPLMGLLKNLGTTGTLAGCVMIFLALRLVTDSGETLRIQGLFEKGISWSLFFLLATALTIAGAITDPSTGVSDWLTQVITPIVGGHSAFLLIALLCLIGTVMTAISNNAAAAAVLTPIAFTIGEACGANSAALIVCVMNACNIGLATPPASGPASILHGDTEWIPGKTAYIDGTLWSVANYVLIMVIMYPIASIML